MKKQRKPFQGKEEKGRNVKNRLIHWLLILTILLSSISFTGIDSYADSVSFQVAGENIIFDTGSGTHGDVVLRVNPSNPTQVEYSVNGGNWTAVASTSITLPANVTDVFTDQAKAFRRVNMENLFPGYNGTTSVPHYNNFTIGSGILLTTNGYLPMSLKVKNTLLVESNAVLFSMYGQGGWGGDSNNANQPGQAGQDITIEADNVTVASGGLIFSGGGGGGGGGNSYWAGYYSAGRQGASGGKGGDIHLYTKTLVVSGEIRTGTGGGGGGNATANIGQDETWSGGSGGDGGLFKLRGEYITINGQISTGVNGRPGASASGGKSSGTAPNSSGGDGAGGGGAGSPNYIGKNGGSGFFVTGQDYTTTVVGGVPINRTNFMGNNCGILDIAIKNINKNFLMVTGFTSGNSGTTTPIAFKFENIYDSPEQRLDIENFYTYNNNNKTITKPGHLVLYNRHNKGKTSFFGTINITNGTLKFDNILFDTASYNRATTTINNNSDTYFINTTPWTSTVYVNGLLMLDVSPTVTYNDLGINEVELRQWFTHYVQSGSTPKNGATYPLDFVFERTTDGTTWTRSNNNRTYLADTSTVKDMGTVVGLPITYRVGFKRTDKAGYVFIADRSVVGISPGGGGLDESAPTIAYFQVGDGKKETNKDKLPVQIVATDNRTNQENLMMQMQVNDKYYAYGNNVFTEGTADNTWSRYYSYGDGLPLREGFNEVILRVKDEAGNIAIRIETILFVKKDGSTITPNIPDDILNPSTDMNNVAITITNPLGGNQPIGTTIINGVNAWSTNSNQLNISFDKAKLPANIEGVRYSLSGDQYSESLDIEKMLELQLPPTNGIYRVKVQFITDTGLRSSVPNTIYIVLDNQSPILNAKITTAASITLNSSINVKLEIMDNVSTTFKWSADKFSWVDIPIDNIVTITLTAGLNNKSIYVKDAAGNIGEATVRIWKK